MRGWLDIRSKVLGGKVISNFEDFTHFSTDLDQKIFRVKRELAELLRK